MYPPGASINGLMNGLRWNLTASEPRLHHLQQVGTRENDGIKAIEPGDAERPLKVAETGNKLSISPTTTYDQGPGHLKLLFITATYRLVRCHSRPNIHHRCCASLVF